MFRRSTDIILEGLQKPTWKGGRMPIDYLYERKKKMDKDDAKMEWIEAKINDVILEYCNLVKVEATAEHRNNAKEVIVRALKNV